MRAERLLLAVVGEGVHGVWLLSVGGIRAAGEVTREEGPSPARLHGPGWRGGRLPGTVGDTCVQGRT